MTKSERVSKRAKQNAIDDDSLRWHSNEKSDDFIKLDQCSSFIINYLEFKMHFNPHINHINPLVHANYLQFWFIFILFISCEHMIWCKRYEVIGWVYVIVCYRRHNIHVACGSKINDAKFDLKGCQVPSRKTSLQYRSICLMNQPHRICKKNVKTGSWVWIFFFFFFMQSVITFHFMIISRLSIQSFRSFCHQFLEFN